MEASVGQSNLEVSCVYNDEFGRLHRVSLVLNECTGNLELLGAQTRIENGRARTRFQSPRYSRQDVSEE